MSEFILRKALITKHSDNCVLGKKKKSRKHHKTPPNCAFVTRALCVCVCVFIQVLLPAASLLQLMDVRQACCDFLQSQLHPSNCLGIRAFADVHTCTQLVGQAHAYAGKMLELSTRVCTNGTFEVEHQKSSCKCLQYMPHKSLKKKEFKHQTRN